jgi:hypothetical protein
MMTFQAQKLEKKIQTLGGSWERLDIDGRQVFAIIPPKQENAQWCKFKEKLAHFHWEEKEGKLITCDCANAIPLNAATQCFLYVHSTSSCFASDWKRAGFYIGAKQDLVFFDNGNTWKNSGRPPSEESFYLEIEAVYNEIKDQYPIDRLWVGGHCGGAPVAAYLKRLHHHEGINFFVEQSFFDLDDFVKPISPFFAPRVKGSLSDEAFPKNMDHCPPSCQFGAAKLWESLSRYEDSKKGKFIFIQVKDDEHISQQAYQNYLDLAHKINGKVKHLLYVSNRNWHHADNFFHYQMPRQEFIEAIFN